MFGFPFFCASTLSDTNTAAARDCDTTRVIVILTHFKEALQKQKNMTDALDSNDLKILSEVAAPAPTQSQDGLASFTLNEIARLLNEPLSLDNFREIHRKQICQLAELRRPDCQDLVDLLAKRFVDRQAEYTIFFRDYAPSSEKRDKVVSLLEECEKTLPDWSVFMESSTIVWAGLLWSASHCRQLYDKYIQTATVFPSHCKPSCRVVIDAKLEQRIQKLADTMKKDVQLLSTSVARRIPKMPFPEYFCQFCSHDVRQPITFCDPEHKLCYTCFRKLSAESQRTSPAYVSCPHCSQKYELSKIVLKIYKPEPKPVRPRKARNATPYTRK